MATAVYFVRAQCTGCKHVGEYTMSAYEYAVKCAGEGCPQYIGVSPTSGLKVMDLCPRCNRAYEDHWNHEGEMTCRK